MSYGVFHKLKHNESNWSQSMLLSNFISTVLHVMFYTFLTHGYSVGVFVSHRYHSISISAFFCVLIASSLLCAPGGNRLDQSRTSLEDFSREPVWPVYTLDLCLFVQICIEPSLKRNSFLLRFYRTHVTIIIACIWPFLWTSPFRGLLLL